MRQSWSVLALLVLIGALVLAAFAIRTLPAPQAAQQQAAATLPPPTAPSVDVANPTKGPWNAPISIVEYGDFLCDSCAKMSPDLDRLLAVYPTSIRLVWKDFPDTAAHAGADTSSLAARCAQQQGRFWEYHDLLFAQRIAPDEASLIAAAGVLKLDTGAFKACLTAKDTVPIVNRDFIEGQRLNIDGTPYFFINDRRFSGALDHDQLTKIVETLGAVKAVAPAPAPAK